MTSHLPQRIIEVFKKCSIIVSDFHIELESKEYDACRFKLNGLKVISRSAKITPKKVGQFVTFWKRQGNGPIEAFSETDEIDFYIVNVKNEKEFGQFVFPKSVLIKNGIIATAHKDGKRGFRVYPNWDLPNNKQAERTQKWQLEYFYVINDSTDNNKVKELYKVD